MRINKSQILDFIAFYKTSQLLWNWGCKQHARLFSFWFASYQNLLFGHINIRTCTQKKQKTHTLLFYKSCFTELNPKCKKNPTYCLDCSFMLDSLYHRSYNLTCTEETAKRGFPKTCCTLQDIPLIRWDLLWIYLEYHKMTTFWRWLLLVVLFCTSFLWKGCPISGFLIF